MKIQKDAAQRLASEHYENFPVKTFLLPPKIRQAIVHIYAFARLADDIVDEGNHSSEQRHAELDVFHAHLDAIEANKTPSDPFFEALAEQIKLHDLPISSFRQLLTAFRQDIDKKTYQTMEEVLQYCQNSANPIGHLVLKLYKIDSASAIAASNGTCTGLQLVNFLQDLQSDWTQRQRCYIPLSDLATHALTPEQFFTADPAVQRQVLAPLERESARQLVNSLPLLWSAPLTLRLYLRAVAEGGAKMLQHCMKRSDPLERPKLTKSEHRKLILNAFLGKSRMATRSWEKLHLGMEGS